MDVALVILDGWGIATANDTVHRNAVESANTPRFDQYASAGATGRLAAAGRAVGLPAGQIGNSEVGHLNLGAGRVVYQEYTRINDAIAAAEIETLDNLRESGDGGVGDPPFDRNGTIRAAFNRANQAGNRVHLVGLVSDGGVHADHRHLHALVELAERFDVEAVTHAITDGRDTPPTSGSAFLSEFQSVIGEYGTGDVATVVGRYYAMDRDRNWTRTRRTYDAMVERSGEYTARTPVEAIEAAYQRDTTDEFVEPTLIDGGPPISEDDVVIFANFRADRTRQLVRMLSDLKPPDSSVAEAEITWPEPPRITIVTMTEYDRRFEFPVAFPTRQHDNVFGAVVAAADHTQLRIAESEKYAHVTYFFNGGREVEFSGESREIIQSPAVTTYDQQPEMSAPAVTDRTIEILQTSPPDVMILNYANPDMVGHTGEYEATVAAVEAVDEAVGQLVPTCLAAGSDVILTADHGNAEDMGTVEQPHTAHTTNEVPFVYLDTDGTSGGYTIRSEGKLADVAPTMLFLLGIKKPADMTGRSLLL